MKTQRILVLLVCITAILVSCGRYVITQEVKPVTSSILIYLYSQGKEIKSSKYEDLIINTEIWYKGDLIKLWSDPANDTIKCYRYKQAESYIKLIKELKKPCKREPLVIF